MAQNIRAMDSIEMFKDHPNIDMIASPLKNLNIGEGAIPED